MNLEEIRKRIDDIKAMAADDQLAHEAEDGLWRDVLQTIADGACDDPTAAARLVLTTSEIDFARWCA
jgi:hypothetical protein